MAGKIEPQRHGEKSGEAESASTLLAIYMTDLQRLTAQRVGIDRAIHVMESKIEAAREILGLPIKIKRGPKPKNRTPKTGDQ